MKTVDNITFPLQIHINLIRRVTQDQLHSVTQFQLDRTEVGKAFEEYQCNAKACIQYRYISTRSGYFHMIPFVTCVTQSSLHFRRIDTKAPRFQKDNRMKIFPCVYSVKKSCVYCVLEICVYIVSHPIRKLSTILIPLLVNFPQIEQ